MDKIQEKKKEATENFQVAVIIPNADLLENKENQLKIIPRRKHPASVL